MMMISGISKLKNKIPEKNLNYNFNLKFRGNVDARLPDGQNLCAVVEPELQVLLSIQGCGHLDLLGLGLEAHDNDALQPGLGLKLGRVLDISGQTIILEVKFEVNKFSVTIFVGLAVVNVEGTLCRLVNVESDNQGVWIIDHQSR